MMRICVTWDLLLVLLNPPQDFTSCRAGARPGHPISDRCADITECSFAAYTLLRSMVVSCQGALKAVHRIIREDKDVHTDVHCHCCVSCFRVTRLDRRPCATG